MYAWRLRHYSPAWGQSVPKDQETSVRDASTIGRIIQGTHHARDGTSEDFSFGDTLVGDEITLHRLFILLGLPFILSGRLFILLLQKSSFTEAAVRFSIQYILRLQLDYILYTILYAQWYYQNPVWILASIIQRNLFKIIVYLFRFCLANNPTQPILWRGRAQ
jgi:hypothetical protein